MPDLVSPESITSFYKYDSGNKTFKEIAGTKNISESTDAFAFILKIVNVNN